MADPSAHIPYRLFADLAEGKITHKMFVVLIWLYRRAGYTTGLAKRVSAKAIIAEMYGDELEMERPSERRIQEAIKQLNLSGYITSHHVPGRRGSYEISINNFVVVISAEKKVTLRQTETVYWRDLLSNLGGDVGDESSGDLALTRPRIHLPSLDSTSSPAFPLEKSKASGSESDAGSGADAKVAPAGESKPEREVELPQEVDSPLPVPVEGRKPLRPPVALPPLNLNEIESSHSAYDFSIGWCETKQKLGQEFSHLDTDPVWFELLIKSHGLERVSQVMEWLPKSDYWMKPGILKDAEGLFYAFPTIAKQCDKFRTRRIEAQLKGKTLRKKKPMEAVPMSEGRRAWEIQEEE